MVNSYGARWVKNIKDNVMCFNKQQIKDGAVHLLFKIFCQILGIPMGSDPDYLFQLVLIFY